MFYNFLKQGDIIWAKRYKNKKEKNKIIEGHQEGPYIIIKKGIFSLYALQCTSKIKNIDLDNQYYKLDEKYKLIKKTYVRLINFEKLKYKQFIRKIDELEFSDYNYLLKKISLISKKFKYKFAKGDVIKYKNNTYYIYDVNKKYLCYKITKKNNNKNIVINNYSFDFNSTHKINKFNKLVLVDCFDKKEIKIISEKQNEICTKRNSKDKRGFLVKIDEKFYLIYDSLLNDFLAYKIYLDNNYKTDMKDITINGGKYYTYFETVKFSKEREFKKYRIASSEELNKIKALKKNNKQIYFKQFQIKSIIENQITNKRYVIIKRINNYIKCVEIENFDNIIDIELNNNSPYYYIETLSDYAFRNIKIKLNNFVKF